MGIFSRFGGGGGSNQSANGILEEAMRSVSLFANQEYEDFETSISIESPSGRLGRYISQGRYHAHVSMSFLYGTVRMEVSYDPRSDLNRKAEELRALAPSSTYSAHVTNPEPGLGVCLIIEAPATSSNVSSVARTVAKDAADIIQMAG